MGQTEPAVGIYLSVGATFSELIAAMGINPPSFYATFGSKKQLFRRALALYRI